MMESNRLDILQKIESGEVSAEEGLRLINEADGQLPQAEPQLASAAPDSDAETRIPPLTGEFPPGPADLPNQSRFRAISWLIFGVFLILTLISANWMVQGWQASNFGWGFWLSWIPFIIGVVGMATSLNARWLHLRVTENKGSQPRNIRISLPLPLGLASWILKVSQGWLPAEVREKHIGEVLDELNKGIRRDQPFYLEVDEEDEHVEIYIG